MQEQGAVSELPYQNKYQDLALKIQWEDCMY